MKLLEQHIILIGFKHVGKSILGKYLAAELNKTHIDLDQQIEELYQNDYQTPISCREIMQLQGEDFFRALEGRALQQVLQRVPSIISLGGGTPMLEENRQLLQGHCIIHIMAQPEQIFQRIMRKGRPAFFNEQEEPWVTFNRLWLQREKVYQQLATFSIQNDGPLVLTLQQLFKRFQ